VVFWSTPLPATGNTQRLRLIHLPSSTGEVVVWAGRKADDPSVVASPARRMLAEIEHDTAACSICRDERARPIAWVISGCMPGNMNNVRKLCCTISSARPPNSGLLEPDGRDADGLVKRYSKPEHHD